MGQLSAQTAVSSFAFSAGVGDDDAAAAAL